MTEIQNRGNMELFCWECGKLLKGQQTKFCSRKCKDIWWTKHNRYVREKTREALSAIMDIEKDKMGERHD